MAVLMDSCSVVKGSRNLLKLNIMKVLHQLIDIGSDSCQHIHNACKKSPKNFNKCLEKLYQDIYNDFKWSEDMRVILQDICKCLNVTYR